MLNHESFRQQTAIKNRTLPCRILIDVPSAVDCVFTVDSLEMQLGCSEDTQLKKLHKGYAAFHDI